MLDAVRRQRRLERDTRRRRKPRRDRRPLIDDGAPAHAPFPCMQLCPDCGWFDRISQTCPECGTEMHDLTNHFTALANRDAMEQALEQPHGPVASTVRLGTSLLTGVGLGAACVALAWGTVALIPIAAAGVVLGAGVGALVSKDTALIVTRSMPQLTGRAIRWHRSVPATSTMLRSPFRQRQCRGWRVRVEYSADGTGGTWRPVIDEQHAPYGLEIAHPTTPIAPDEQTRLGRYLRERGFFEEDGEYRAFEAFS